jgi:SAM-dependent methyltransferase
MLSRVYSEFERICNKRHVGGAVLEVGAIPSDASLLCMKSLRNATEKVGLNLEGPAEYQDFKILRGDGNCMDCFEDSRFDTVLCNAILEHDPYFWKSVAEMKRVTKPGGLMVIGAPGYVRFSFERFKRRLQGLQRIPLVRQMLANENILWLLRGTLTIDVHDAPGDYYRFSLQTFREVFFDGMRDVEVCSVMVPPIIIGSGIKP